MAVERKVETKQSMSAGTAARKLTAKPKTTAAKPAGPQTAERLRADLVEARRQHALEKLDKPHTIRRLRKDLARALTADRAKQPKGDA